MVYVPFPTQGVHENILDALKAGGVKTTLTVAMILLTVGAVLMSGRVLATHRTSDPASGLLSPFRLRFVAASGVTMSVFGWIAFLPRSLSSLDSMLADGGTVGAWWAVDSVDHPLGLQVALVCAAMTFTLHAFAYRLGAKGTPTRRAT